MEDVGAEAERLELPGAHVLDQHVRVIDQTEQPVTIVPPPKVELHEPLVPVGDLEEVRLVVGRVPPTEVSRRVANAGALHLDHVGPEVGEMAGASGSGQDSREIEHADVGQWARRRSRRVRPGAGDGVVVAGHLLDHRVRAIAADNSPRSRVKGPIRGRFGAATRIRVEESGVSGSSSSATPNRRAAARGAGRGRRPTVIVGSDPALDGVQLIGRTTAWVLVVTLSTAIVLSILSLATTPGGWMVTATAALLASTIPWAHTHLRRRSVRRLAIADLAPRWAAPVSQAANHAAQLRLLAERAPAGPVAEHLDRLADTADRYLLLMHDAAAHADTASRAARLGDGDRRPFGDPELEADLARLNGELAELVEAAERLRAAQQRQREPSPLVELAAQTDRLAASLDDAAVDQQDPTRPSDGGPELPPRAGFG